MKKILIAVLVLAVLALGGWAFFSRDNSGNNSPAPSTNNSTQTNNPAASKPAAGAITIKTMQFTPSQISVQKGATVTWTNDDNVAHTVTDDLSNVGGPASDSIPPGGTYSFTFTKTGSFQYHCTFHPSMRGTIVVQ